MKIILTLCAAAIVFGAGVFVGHGRLNDLMARWREPAANPDIVMLGDSLTAAGDWAARFPAVRIATLAVNGSTAAGVLDRLDEATRRKPRAAFVMVGVNDLARDMPMDLTQRQIEVIASRLAAGGTTPIVQGVVFVAASWRPQLNDKIAALNTRLAAWCRANGIAYIDINAGLAPRGALDPSFTTDGLHLNDSGNAAWADAIRPFVDRAMTRR